MARNSSNFENRNRASASACASAAAGSPGFPLRTGEHGRPPARRSPGRAPSLMRFLTSSMKWDQVTEDWYSTGWFTNPSDDDGWWIDDVRVTHTLTEPVTVMPDTAPRTNW